MLEIANFQRPLHTHEGNNYGTGGTRFAMASGVENADGEKQFDYWALWHSLMPVRVTNGRTNEWADKTHGNFASFALCTRVER